jgi:hypothetical protein
MITPKKMEATNRATKNAAGHGMAGKKIGVLAHPVVALIAVALPACSAAPGDSSMSQERTDTSSAAVSWVGLSFWGQWGNVGPDLNLGPASTQTCFLTGVHGQLIGTTSDLGSSPQATARVYVDDASGNYFLQTHQGSGNGVNASAACVPYTGNRAFFSSASGVPTWQYGWGLTLTVTIPALGTPNRLCFLTGLSSFNGFSNQGIPTYTQLVPPGRSRFWQFITQVDFATDSGYPGGSAEAVCFDVQAYQGGVGPLQQENVDWFTSEPNIACGLTYIGGDLTDDPLVGNDGVGLSYSAPWWGISSTSGKAVATSCFL